MEFVTYEPKLNIIGVNSLRLGSLQLLLYKLQIELFKKLFISNGGVQGRMG